MLKLQVIGNLGRDAVLNQVNGKSVINFTIAHNERYKDNTGTIRERTQWIDCAFWTDRSTLAQYLLKGKLVYVEGSPVVEMYTSKDGKQGVALRLRVQDVQFIGSPRDNQQGETQTPIPSTSSNTTDNDNYNSSPASDDLPF